MVVNERGVVVSWLLLLLMVVVLLRECIDVIMCMIVSDLLFDE